MILLILKTSAIWFLIAVLAIGNGFIREYLLMPVFGIGAALPLSGLLLALIVFALTFLVLNWLGRQREIIYWAIGLQWVLMTLAFEFLFGHYVGGKAWSEIVRIFNPLTGDLFTVVLGVTLLSPWLVAKLKNII